jgi:hypothetical protein
MRGSRAGPAPRHGVAASWSTAPAGGWFVAESLSRNDRGLLKSIALRPRCYLAVSPLFRPLLCR